MVTTMPHTETVANLLDTIIPKQRVQAVNCNGFSDYIMLNHLLTLQLYSCPPCDRCTVPPYDLGVVNEGGTILIPAPGHSTEIVHTSA